MANLEPVFQRQSNIATVADRVRDLPEGSVRNVAVGLSIAGDVEGVEGIRTELEMMPVMHAQGLRQGHVDIVKTRCAEGSRTHVA